MLRRSPRHQLSGLSEPLIRKKGCPYRLEILGLPVLLPVRRACAGFEIRSRGPVHNHHGVGSSCVHSRIENDGMVWATRGDRRRSPCCYRLQKPDSQSKINMHTELRDGRQGGQVSRMAWHETRL
jgi:hypothetical protein